MARFLPRHLSERRQAGLMNAVRTGLALSADKHPQLLPRGGRRPSEAERRRYHDLQKRRDDRAARLGIDPTLIASRATLSELARNWDQHAGELMSWQLESLK
jgi:ribonuclease D